MKDGEVVEPPEYDEMEPPEDFQTGNNSPPCFCSWILWRLLSRLTCCCPDPDPGQDTGHYVGVYSDQQFWNENEEFSNEIHDEDQYQDNVLISEEIIDIDELLEDVLEMKYQIKLIFFKFVKENLSSAC